MTVVTKVQRNERYCIVVQEGFNQVLPTQKNTMRQLQVLNEVVSDDVLVLAKEALVNLRLQLVTKPGVVGWIVDDASLASSTVEFLLAGGSALQSSTPRQHSITVRYDTKFS